MTGSALSHHASSPGVTLITAQHRMLSQQRPGMLEFLSHRDIGGFWHRGFLADDRVAELTILAQHLAFPAHMVSFVAAKAARI